jgi:four helix bundle protein
MATFRRFEDIEAWRKARDLTKQIYVISSRSAFGSDYALRDQVRRASVSIMANIAEGFGRSGSKEFLQFLANAKGSATEVQSHLYVALDQRYLDAVQFQPLYDAADEIGRMINGLMTYLRSSGVKGIKFSGAAKTAGSLNSRPETRDS